VIDAPTISSICLTQSTGWSGKSVWMASGV
jgi:hypothetical protein